MTLRQKHVEADITLEVPDGVEKVLLSSLKPEAESPTSDRSVVSLGGAPGRLTIQVSADDVTAARAAVNSYLHWAQGIIDISLRLKKGEFARQ